MCFILNDTATTEFYTYCHTLSLHYALPICLTNLFVPPILNRIDMLTTGIKSPIGIKISGPDIDVLARLGAGIEEVAVDVPGVSSAIAERTTGCRYLDVEVKPAVAARYGLTQADVQQLIAPVVGGQPVAQTIEGRERYPVVVRSPRAQRDSIAELARLPLVAPNGVQIGRAHV